MGLPIDIDHPNPARPVEDSLDGVRGLVLRRSRELGLSLADLSRAVSKNQTYFHQFMWRQSPKHLPEEVRHILANLMQIPEEDLRSVSQQRARMTAPPRGSVALLANQKSIQAPPPGQPASLDVPVFAEGDAIDLSHPSDSTTRPPLLTTANAAFALWIGHDRGRRLSQGDLAFVHGGQIGRVGDAVVVLRRSEIVAVGELESVAQGYATIDTGGETPSRIAIQPGDRVLKVVCVQFG